jgi:hypothetical protein
VQPDPSDFLDQITPKINRPPRKTRQPAAHHGTFIVVLGVFGLFFVPCAVAAWIAGAADLDEMRAGRMDRQGQSLTSTGMALGIVGVLLTLLAMVLYFGIWLASPIRR